MDDQAFLWFLTRQEGNWSFSIWSSKGSQNEPWASSNAGFPPSPQITFTNVTVADYSPTTKSKVKGWRSKIDQLLPTFYIDHGLATAEIDNLLNEKNNKECGGFFSMYFSILTVLEDYRITDFHMLFFLIKKKNVSEYMSR